MEVIFRVGIAILLLNLDELRCLDMEETIKVDSLMFRLLTYLLFLDLSGHLLTGECRVVFWTPAVVAFGLMQQ